MGSISLAQVTLGAVFLLAALAARPLVGLNLLLYRKVGLSNFAVAWERRRGRWIATVRIVAAVLALAFLMSGLGVLRSG